MAKIQAQRLEKIARLNKRLRVVRDFSLHRVTMLNKAADSAEKQFVSSGEVHDIHDIRAVFSAVTEVLEKSNGIRRDSFSLTRPIKKILQKIRLLQAESTWNEEYTRKSQERTRSTTTPGQFGGDCFSMGLNGQCGFECPILLQGECEDPPTDSQY